jgi:molybdate transport system substrate-binding protein
LKSRRIPLVLLAIFVTACAHQSRPPLRVLSAIGMRLVVLDIVPKFERATGQKVSASFHSGAVIAERLNAGESADVVLLPTGIVKRLAGAGILTAESATEIAIARVGVAVRRGMPKPDISTADAFRNAMLQARSIACPDPKMGGSSGLHIARLFERLGIAEAVQPKLVLASTPDVPGTLPGDLVARGDADIALHQMQELMAVPGIEVAGPLPDELQARLGFAVAVLARTPQPDSARTLLDWFRSPETTATIRAKGMEPVSR